MERLKEVEAARALMTEAMDWSVIMWLKEKKRVRTVADAANATLDRVEQQVQDGWPAELISAYAGDGGKGEVLKLANAIHEAHEAAIRARLDAEETFDKAERRLSTSLAREGCHKAIAGWELHEEAIRKAEAAVAKK